MPTDDVIADFAELLALGGDGVRYAPGPSLGTWRVERDTDGRPTALVMRRHDGRELALVICDGRVVEVRPPKP
jgi:hypothetical protein